MKFEKYIIENDIREFGNNIKKAFKKNNIYSILSNSPIESGPFDGGCRIVARTLKKLKPEGKIITITSDIGDDNWQAEHYGLAVDSGVIDGDGFSSSKEIWAKNFTKREFMSRPYKIVDKEVSSEFIDTDEETEKKLALALKNFISKV